MKAPYLTAMVLGTLVLFGFGLICIGSVGVLPDEPGRIGSYPMMAFVMTVFLINSPLVLLGKMTAQTSGAGSQ